MTSKKDRRAPGQPKLPKDREWVQWGIDHIPKPLPLSEIQKKAAAEKLVPARTRVTGRVKLVRKPGFFSPAISWPDYDSGLARQGQIAIDQDGYVEQVVASTITSDAMKLVRDRLRKLPRRAAFLVFCEIMGPQLRAGKYTRVLAAAKLKIPEHSVLFLLRHRLRLYDMVEPVRRAAGLTYRGGKKSAKAEWSSEVVAALLPLTTPTGLLGLVARALHKDGERAAYRILRHLDRAMARPIGREADLAHLLHRYGMIAQLPATLQSRAGAAPPPASRKIDIEARASVAPNALPLAATAAPSPPPPAPAPPPPLPPWSASTSTPASPSPGAPGAVPAAAPDGKVCPRCGTLVRIPGGGTPKFCSACTSPL